MTRPVPLPIPREAVEAAMRAIHNEEHPGAPFPESNEQYAAIYSMKARAAIRAVWAALGITEEEDDSPDIYVDREGFADVTPRHRRRLVSEWQAVNKEEETT